MVLITAGFGMTIFGVIMLFISIYWKNTGSAAAKEHGHDVFGNALLNMFCCVLLGITELCIGLSEIYTGIAEICTAMAAPG